MPRCGDCDRYFSQADGGCDCFVERLEAEERGLIGSRSSAPPKERRDVAVKDPDFDAELYRQAEESHAAIYGYGTSEPLGPEHECPCCGQRRGECPRCFHPHAQVVEDLHGKCCVECAARDSEGDVILSEDNAA